VASNFYIYVVGASGGSSVRRADPLGGFTNTTKSLTASGATSGIAGAAYDNDRKIYLLDNTSREVDCYQESSNVYTLASSLGWSGGASTVSAIAIDSADTSIALLDAGNNQIDVYSDRSVNGAATPTSSISLAGLGVTTPTGLAISGRTGNYLVLDSALQSGTSVRLFVINTAGTLVSTISINVTSSNSVDIRHHRN
jgi:hypothetical protein